jgi:hypothetical protein
VASAAHEADAEGVRADTPSDATHADRSHPASAVEDSANVPTASGLQEFPYERFRAALTGVISVEEYGREADAFVERQLP